jgi:leucyl aminopeptidase
MRIRVTASDLARQQADVAACFACEGDARPRGVRDAALRRELAREMKRAGFRGKSGDLIEWSPNGRFPARRILVVGIGAEIGESAVRLACARAARAAQELSASSLSLRMPDDKDGAAFARVAVEGVLFGDYRFEGYLHEPARRASRLKSLEVGLTGSLPAAKRSASLAEAGARAVLLARDLVNEAPSRKAPAVLAREAAKRARKAGLTCKVLDPARLRRIGLGALLAVSRGSAEPPRVVHLTYRPRGGAKRKTRAPRILLVGKGVTFDSGGLNLKPGDSMLTMKMDMGGAAAVLAAMTALRDVGCPYEVHALLGLVENMTGSAAYKPGDILDTWAGTTVEVGNTDAEGRLVLCDLLAWGIATIKPTRVVDLATLTGACVVALGQRASGLFARDDALSDELLEAAGAAGEKLWRLPLYEEYLSLLQKGPADLINVGGRWGGAITAALFLGEFVPRSVPWAHIDIAGPAFTEEDLPDAAIGGTGAGVLTLVRWLGRS